MHVENATPARGNALFAKSCIARHASVSRGWPANSQRHRKETRRSASRVAACCAHQTQSFPEKPERAPAMYSNDIAGLDGVASLPQFPANSSSRFIRRIIKDPDRRR
jgi:hypothetical protein